jgi:hypothetical protein
MASNLIELPRHTVSDDERIVRVGVIAIVTEAIAES